LIRAAGRGQHLADLIGQSSRSAAAVVAAIACAALIGGCKRGGQATTSALAASCLGNAACGPGEFCAFSPALCGRGPVPGSCKPRPASCGKDHTPVCGCDGKIHDDECAAHAAGVDLDVTGSCKAVLPDWAPCGPRYCDVRTSYCEIYLSDVFEIPTTYTCRPLPAACRPVAGDAGAHPTCGCFPAGTPCLSFCGPLPTGGLTGFHLTCQGVKEPKR
jgi:hypothetical protein